MILSDKERDKFTTWLEIIAQGSLGMAAQMKKINVPSSLIAKEENLARACHIVATYLSSTETMNEGEV